MAKSKPPETWQIAWFHILLSVICAMAGVMFGGTIAALRNGASHVTAACGMGIAGCGSSQHWAVWSVAVALLYYAGIINGLIVESTYRPEVTSTGDPGLGSVLVDGVRWVKSRLNAANPSPRFKQWLVLSLLLSVIGTIASAATGGAVGGYIYGNFITGMGAAHGVPGVGWFFGMIVGPVAAALGAMLLGGMAGVSSGVLLRRQLRSHGRS